MKKLVLLFAALLVAGCGEKSSSKGGWLNKDPEYPAEWPNIGESSGEWLTHPLSEAEVDQLEVILASVDRLDGFDEEQKALLDRVAGNYIIGDGFDEFHLNSPLLLKGKPFTGFTRLGSWWERWKEGKIIFSVQYRLAVRKGFVFHISGGYKWTQSWSEDSDHVARGTTMSWHENGQKASQRLFKDGKQESTTSWHENGQKAGEATYKDGKRNGPATSWHENGQKEREGTYKDGKKDGLRTRWHENGQKWAEGTYKDGEKISDKYWNSKGEEVDSWAETYD